MSELLLSICIPTYNRADYLDRGVRAALKASEGYDDVTEILISDNDSKDSTGERLSNLKREFPRLIIFKNETNIGAEKNNSSLIEKARGRYIWLVGDDDVILPNAVSEIIHALKKGVSSLILNYRDLNKKGVESGPYFSYPSELYKNSNECMKRFRFHISFISSLVMPRNWLVRNYSAFIGVGFAHLAVFYLSLSKDCNLTFLNNPCVLHQIEEVSDFGEFSLSLYLIEGVPKILAALQGKGYSRKSIELLAAHAMEWALHPYEELTRYQFLKKFPFSYVCKNYRRYPLSFCTILNRLMPKVLNAGIRTVGKKLMLKN